MASMPFTPCSPGQCTDVTVNILETVFGPVIGTLTRGEDPSNVDGVASVIATMMGYFNSGILTVAALILAFVTVVGVINTANDGEAFGKNWSSLWTPVRIVTGAAVLLPTGAGYSFIQIFVMMISLWAIGFANGAFKIGVEHGILGGSLQNVSKQMGLGKGDGANTGPAPNQDFPLYNMRQLASSYTSSAYCAKAVNSVYKKGVVSGIKPPDVSLAKGGKPDRSIADGDTKIVHTYEFKDRNAIGALGGGKAICGTIQLYEYKYVAPTYVADSGRALSLVLDDKARNANSMAISKMRDAALKSKLVAIKTMMAEIDQWVKQDWPEDINQDWSKVSVGDFNRIVDNAQANMMSDLSNKMKNDSGLKDLMTKFTEDITGDGWAMAGGFYQRLGGIRDEMREIYSETPGVLTQPALGWLPDDAKGNLVRQSLTMAASVSRKALENDNLTSKSAGSSDVAGIIPDDLDDIDIDQMGSRGNKVMNGLIGNLLESVTNTAIGADGNVDALARIKATGDTLAVAHSRIFLISNGLKKAAGAIKTAVGVASGVPFAGTSAQNATEAIMWLLEALILEPLSQIIPWLDLLAGYFGVFLPSLPYAIFIIAVIGWILSVVQTVFAAPLWAVMHMTPERSFVGSQTQGYLMFLSLFTRPVLIVVALFAALLLANPIILYVSKAFWAMRTANVSSSESLGWLVQFLTWKNWLIMYGLVLLPVVYMIFGLTQALPDAILTWIGAGIKPLGETQATSEMRAGAEKHATRSGSQLSMDGAANSSGGNGGQPLPNEKPKNSPNGGESPGDSRLLSETGQANTTQTPEFVEPTKANNANVASDTVSSGAPSQRTRAGPRKGADTGGTASAVTTSSDVASPVVNAPTQGTDSQSDDRPINNETHNAASSNGKESADANNKVDAMLNDNQANPAGADNGDAGSNPMLNVDKGDKSSSDGENDKAAA